MKRAIVGVLVALFAAGCTRTLDPDKVQAGIKDECTKQGVTLSSVSCPAGIKAEQGTVFKCTSKTEAGADVTWDVTVKSPNGDYDFKSLQVMDQQKLGDQVEPLLAQKVGGPIDMKCPSKWIVATPGAKFSCDATVGGSAKTVDCVFGEGTKYDCQLH